MSGLLLKLVLIRGVAMLGAGSAIGRRWRATTTTSCCSIRRQSSRFRCWTTTRMPPRSFEPRVPVSVAWRPGRNRRRRAGSGLPYMTL